VKKKRQICLENFIYSRAETPIWRVFRQRDLISWLNEEKLYFPRPQDWDDPFENILLKQRYHIAGTNIPLEFSRLLDRYVGQCWTRRHDETDATWRIYAPGKNGVRVKTTVGKLYEALQRRHGSIHQSGDFFICRVDYFSEEEICKRARLAMEYQEPGLEESEEDPRLEFLTVKRPEFKHEAEVRVIYRLAKAATTSDRFLLLPSSTSVIEEIVIDPRTDADNVIAFTETVRRLFRLLKNPVVSCRAL
jgi:Protein of unknown function (DUF2971)